LTAIDGMAGIDEVTAEIFETIEAANLRTG
jgi:hypothetical protein